MIRKKKIFVAVTTDVVSDMRVRKVCSFLLSKNSNVYAVGRLTDQTPKDKPTFEVKLFKMLFSKGALFYTEFNIRLFLKGLFIKMDVIVSNDLDTLLPCFLLSKIKGADLVYDSHEYFTESVGLQGRNFQKKFWLKLEQFLLPKVKHAYTVSEPIKEVYTAKYGVDFKLVRNFPEQNFQFSTINDFHFGDNKIILYQGVFNPGRSLEEVIEAMQYIDNAVFVLIGYGEIEHKLRQMVYDFNLKEKVFFLGKMAYNEMMNYTHQSDLGIALEQPLGDSFKFSLPNKVFDYTHANLPFVSGGTQEVRKILEHYKLGEIISFSNPKELANEINRVVSDKILLDDIKSNQKEYKNIFSWENECVQLLEVYKDLL